MELIDAKEVSICSAIVDANLRVGGTQFASTIFEGILVNAYFGAIKNLGKEEALFLSYGTIACACSKCYQAIPQVLDKLKAGHCFGP